MSADDQPAMREAVCRALRDRFPEAEVKTLVPMVGGRSGVTLVADVSGVTLDRDEVTEVVVKASPPARRPVGRHDIDRQRRVLEALAATPGVVVPRVLGHGGHPVQFCVMTRAPGEAVEPVLDAATRSVAGGVARERALSAARMLAALHRVVDVPAPPGESHEPVSHLATEVRRWRATAEAADADVLPGGVGLAKRLVHTMPERTGGPVLVHGDYRLGNIVFDGVVPTGLIDWEIWGRTDPGVDLGWFLVFCDASLFPGIGAPVRGLPTSEELVGAYQEAGGAPVDELPWFEAFGRFKMAAIMAHNLRRHREGRHHDPFQEKLPPTISRLMETATSMVAG